VKTMPCKHSFHNHCLKRWEAQQQQQYRPFSCPFCRTVSTVKAEALPKKMFDERFNAFSTAVGNVVHQLTEHTRSATTSAAATAADNQHKTLKEALKIVADDPVTRGAIKSAVVPSTVGHTALCDCFISNSDGMKSLLPQVRQQLMMPLAGNRRGQAVALDREVSELLQGLGVSGTSTLDGLLHAGSVMRQVVFDTVELRGSPASHLLAAFAAWYALLESHAGRGLDGFAPVMESALTWVDEFAQTCSEDSVNAAKIRAHFMKHDLIFAGGTTAFYTPSQVLWAGNKEVAKVLNKKTMVDYYGQSLKPFFTDTLKLKSVGTEACWQGLKELAQSDGVKYSNVQGCRNLRAQVKKIYTELEKWSKVKKAKTNAGAGAGAGAGANADAGADTGAVAGTHPGCRAPRSRRSC